MEASKCFMETNNRKSVIIRKSRTMMTDDDLDPINTITHPPLFVAPSRPPGGPWGPREKNPPSSFHEIVFLQFIL